MRRDAALDRLFRIFNIVRKQLECGRRRRHFSQAIIVVVVAVAITVDIANHWLN
jgi:hypothetical protein